MVLTTLLNPSYLVNPFFRISKNTPETARRYYFLMKDYPRIFYICVFLFVMPIKFLGFSFILILSLFNSYQYRIYNRKIIISRNLFVTHATKSNLVGSETDRFFDELPKLTREKYFNTIVLYTFQQKFGYKTVDKLLSLKDSNSQHILMPKFLRLSENFTFLKIAMKLSIFCFLTGFRIFFKNKVNSKILFASSLTFLNRNCYVNYLIANRVLDFCQKGITKKIFLTLEGHSYEHLVVHKVSGLDRRIIYFLRQHSPITRDHFGLKYFLESKARNIFVLTTGDFYKRYFESIEQGNNILVLGSSRGAVPNILSHPDINRAILYTPEASSKISLEFMYLVRSLVVSSQDYKHVLRLHPDVRRSFKIRILLAMLKQYDNFELSSTSLILDFQRVDFVIYRSSVVAIESLPTGRILIFYGSESIDNSNVLWGFKNLFHVARSRENLLQLIEEHNNYNKFQISNNIYKSLFSEIDQRVVKEINQITSL